VLLLRKRIAIQGEQDDGGGGGDVDEDDDDDMEDWGAVSASIVLCRVVKARGVRDDDCEGSAAADMVLSVCVGVIMDIVWVSLKQ
jgi:hypothetical protein